jgi:putative DeoR family transcriptional regulator (stage III sporulation protein D)
MRFSSQDRAVLLAQYIIENDATIRQAAAAFNMGKSTVHIDVTEHLKRTNRSLYSQVKCVLEKNKAERHIRGGIATRLKYSLDKEQKAFT